MQAATEPPGHAALVGILRCVNVRGGIKAGMFSPSDPEQVCDALGDKFLRSLATAVSNTRADYDSFRQVPALGIARMGKRALADLIQDRLWNHLVDGLDGAADITATETGPTREIGVGRNIKLRIKRHRDGDLISSYPTNSDRRFWGGSQLALDDLELVHLCAGYRWDDDLRIIGSPVVSYREGKRNPIWSVEIDEPGASANEPIGWSPILPDLPNLDLRSAIESQRNDSA